jgi:hypothetical protein
MIMALPFLRPRVAMRKEARGIIAQHASLASDRPSVNSKLVMNGQAKTTKQPEFQRQKSLPLRDKRRSFVPKHFHRFD